MRSYIFFIFILLFASCNNPQTDISAELQTLYDQLDSEIDRSKDYEIEKNKRIIKYKRDYDLTTDKIKRTELINSLIDEFDAYNADSALYYISYNLRRPAIREIPDEYTRLLIKRADVYAHAGLFSDALATLQAIPRDSLRTSLLEDYYSAYCATYQYLSEYTSEHETALENERQRSLYADSLNSVIAPGSFNHSVYVMTEIARNGHPDEAIKSLSKHLEEYQPGSREYSILASTLAYFYKISENEDDYKRYLVYSAISDIKGAVKENMSFREVATVMYEDGDIERANRYLKKSIADANFYSAIMRNAQSSKLLPVIDEAYSTAQHNLTSRLRTMVWVSNILSVILLISIFWILKQINSLRRAKDKESLINEKLRNMSHQLKSANTELEARNTELREFNQTKEQYAGLFMEYCSSAISTLQRYQQSLRKLTAQGSNRAVLLKKLESTEMADQLLKNFYLKFDEAILNIYPSFVDKFNALLLPDEQIVLKSGELLNTELRLYALIRIGIDDSAKIAEFLRCSISTVYTYRSKMRKRAIDPAEFETAVKFLG